MPINKSALKRERQNKTAYERNKIIKSKVHTAYLKLNESINSKKKDDVDKALKAYVSEVDKAVKKGIFHANKGARNKSRITKRINNTFSKKQKAWSLKSCIKGDLLKHPFRLVNNEQ